MTRFRQPTGQLVLISAAALCAIAAPFVPTARAQTPPAVATATTTPATGGRMFGTLSEEVILHEIRSARIVGRRQVGSTSVNLHLRLAGSIDAAFKPRTSTHADAYRAEIAAFRLNRLLGLNRVPPAASRYIAKSSLSLAADSPVTVERDNTVRGAAIFWVPVLQDSRIDTNREISRWSGWLRQGGTIATSDLVRAEEISTLIAFDVLTGNWDRWSGSNVPMDESGHLVYRDNNGGFSEPFGDAMLRGVMSHLRHVQRFSRSFITKVRAMTDATISAEMALDGDTTHPPLTATQITSLIRRRDALISYVDELIHRHGEANVLFFP